MTLVTQATAQGQRAAQEDRFLARAFNDTALPDGGGWLLAVFDGHGGDLVAVHACLRFEEYFLEHSSRGERSSDALQMAIEQLATATREYAAGSTVSAIFIPLHRRYAYAAVVGDSPVIIRDREGKVWVAPEHNARTNERERDVACQRGARYDAGYLWTADGEYGLQLSRAIGDRNLGFLSQEPEIHAVPLGDDSFVIVASDGIVDAAHGYPAVYAKRVAEIVAGGGDANAIVEDALVRRTGDNVTAVVWQQAAEA
ncbi:MAG: protein serine/threonine phosphatase 2C family protein [Candidatus Terrybacteria bacterium]|nr:protein serine/threonine phosphatase 2C family protein [Candidatus Terrybacteria bacterium]